jgi:hypothetical protein
MNLIKRLNQYNDNNIFFGEPTKNNIIDDGNFIKIIYSNNNISFNGIYLLIELKNIVCEKYYNKYKICFNTSLNNNTINILKNIEQDILKKYNINKNPSFKLNEMLNSGNIKIYNEIDNINNINLLLKISGIWETQFNYGLTFKFLQINPLLYF